jgi:hypothetical protein
MFSADAIVRNSGTRSTSRDAAHSSADYSGLVFRHSSTTRQKKT